ncbi:carbohydrate ABC transporter permease [Chloroflexi bacterium TSY]|nr:carbohydrate ABC transporter permease [Chloroflexi bacterium TSY]
MHRLRLGDILTYLFLIGLTIFVAAPAVWIIGQSFMQEGQILKWPPTFIPSPPTMANYLDLFIPHADRPELPIVRWLINSLFVATSTTVLVVMVASLAAYAFARMEFPGRDWLFLIFGASLLIPREVTLIPTFLIVYAFGWIDTYHALIWPAPAGFFAVFFLRQFFLTIPREMEEAAIIDGCSKLGVYRHIILPLSASAVVTLAIFEFLWNYNSFTWPLIVLNSNEMRTLPVGLTIFNSEYWSEQGMIMAGAVFTSLPIVIFYLLVQRRITESLLTTGLAGR